CGAGRLRGHGERPQLGGVASQQETPLRRQRRGSWLPKAARVSHPDPVHRPVHARGDAWGAGVRVLDGALRMGEAAMSGCAFCTGEAVAMCAACAKSYDRFQRSTKDRGDVLSSMLWAARHARWFAQRKQGLLPILTDAERAAAMAFVRNELVSYKDKAF